MSVGTVMIKVAGVKYALVFMFLYHGINDRVKKIFLKKFLYWLLGFCMDMIFLRFLQIFKNI